MRAELDSLERLEVRHHPDSTVAAMLFAGWLASRLGWELDNSRMEPGTGREESALTGSARTRTGGRRVELRLRAAPELGVPGLAGVALGGESGLRIELDRGPGGLHAHRRERNGTERAFTLLGASRGEGGILGEGIRQALLRDPTYLPALRAARALLPQRPPA
jgi:hypothetical protein